MKISLLSNTSTVLAGLSLALLTAVTSSAVAMPLGSGAAAMETSSLLQHTAYQHRVYPGSDAGVAEKTRDEKRAPNLYCDKHENLCQ